MNKTEKKVDFVNFFDLHDVFHCEAYLALINEGAWPKGFIPENVIGVADGIEIIKGKMAKKWAEHLIVTYSD
jgi:hypothetical protein